MRFYIKQNFLRVQSSKKCIWPECKKALSHNQHWTTKRTQKISFYRPQRSWAKVIFLHVSVILLTGGGLSDLKFWGGCLVWNFRGGCLVWNFWGGVVWSEIFGGGVSGLKFSGGVWNFFFILFSNFFFPQKILLGYTHTSPPPRDGQCAAGTHPTGMHSCFTFFLTFRISEN